MPWLPELFSAPVVQQVIDARRKERLLYVPFFDGLLMGELESLVESFVGEPQLHDPVGGRVRGRAAFEAYVTGVRAYLAGRHAVVEDVRREVRRPRGFEEVVQHLDGGEAVPWAIVADKAEDDRLYELRLYADPRRLTGRHVDRQPLLQPDPALRIPEEVAARLARDAEWCTMVDAGDVVAVEYNRQCDGTPQAGFAVVARDPAAVARIYDDGAPSPT